MLLQDAFASRVNDPGGCPDLGIAVWVDIVHQEIDQPPLFLEHRQEVDDFGVRTARFRLSRRWAGWFGRRLCQDLALTLLQKKPNQNQKWRPQGGS